MWPGGRFWTLPNVLSLSRLALLPLFLYALSRPDLQGLVVALLAYGIVSDVLDGYLARRLGQASEWGRLIDPVADKIIIAAVFLFCVLSRGLPGWIFWAVLARDLGIVGASLLLARRTGALPASNWPGRLTALCLALLAVAYLLDLEPLKAPFLWLSAALLVISSGQYLMRLGSHAA